MAHKILIRLSAEQYRFAESVYRRWYAKYASGIPDLMPFNEFCALALVAAMEDMHQMFLTDSKNKEEIEK